MAVHCTLSHSKIHFSRSLSKCHALNYSFHTQITSKLKCCCNFFSKKKKNISLSEVRSHTKNLLKARGDELDPQMDTGMPLRHYRWGWVGTSIKNYCSGCKSYPYGCKICEKGTFYRLFLAKFELLALIFEKIVKISPL